MNAQRTLEQIAEVTTGFPFPSSDFTDSPSDVRLLRGDNIQQGSLRWSGAARWPAAVQIDDRYVLRPDDVVLAMDRPWVGAGLKFASLRPDDVPSYLVQRVALLRARPETLQRYLHYLVASREFTEHLLAEQTGTAVPHVSAAQIRRFPIPSHTQDEQRGIAEVLGALDDKIAANRAVTAAADELSRALYQRACADPSAAARPLSELAEFVNGKAFTKDASGTGRVVIRIAELNNGVGGSTVRNDIEVADQHLAREGDLLFAWSGSLTVHRWFRREGIINQHIFKVIPRDSTPMWLVDAALRFKLKVFQGIAADKATTMGHIQRRHLDEPVLVPSDDAVTELSDAMTALSGRALSAEVENERLAATRDALLPLLMSGKVRVKDAEKTVGEMV